MARSTRSKRTHPRFDGSGPERLTDIIESTMNTRVTCIVALLVLGPALACSRPEETPEALMSRGLESLYTKGDPEAAARDFRKVLAKNPEHYGAVYQLAVALERGGKPAEARPLWAKSLAMAENDQGREDGRGGTQAARAPGHLPRGSGDESGARRPVRPEGRSLGDRRISKSARDQSETTTGRRSSSRKRSIRLESPRKRGPSGKRPSGWRRATRMSRRWRWRRSGSRDGPDGFGLPARPALRRTNVRRFSTASRRQILSGNRL